MIPHAGGPRTIHSTATGGAIRAALAAGAALALVLAGATAAGAQDEASVEKYVAAVNEAAPEGEPVSVVVGDAITYGIDVAGTESLAGTDVTITDVFDANLLSFQNASGGACAQEGSGADVQIVCTVTLDDTGASQVLLTFSVLEVQGECRELVNTAEVDLGEGETRSAETGVNVCAASEGTAGSAGGSGDSGGGSGGSVSGGDASGAEGGNQPNTAMTAGGAGGSGLLMQLGVLLVASAAVATLHLVPASAVSAMNRDRSRH